MQKTLLLILLSTSFSFAQHSFNDLNEANKVSSLFFNKVFNSCNWGWGLKDSNYGFDTTSIKREQNILSFRWYWSYIATISGQERQFEAILYKMDEFIKIEWIKRGIQSDCLPKGILKM